MEKKYYVYSSKNLFAYFFPSGIMKRREKDGGREENEYVFRSF